MELKEEKHKDESSLKTALLSNLRIVFLPATYILHIALKAKLLYSAKKTIKVNKEHASLCRFSLYVKIFFRTMHL